MPVTGPLSLDDRPAVGVGLHLLSLAYAGTVARASLAAMTEIQSPEGSSAGRELAEIPAVEVISRAAVMLMKLNGGKARPVPDASPDDSPHLDLDEARRVITALAGLVTASVEYLGPHAGPIREGSQALQRAFREASAAPGRARARAPARSTPARSGSHSHPFDRLSEYPRGL